MSPSPDLRQERMIWPRVKSAPSSVLRHSHSRSRLATAEECRTARISYAGAPVLSHGPDPSVMPLLSDLPYDLLTFETRYARTRTDSNVDHTAWNLPPARASPSWRGFSRRNRRFSHFRLNRGGSELVPGRSGSADHRAEGACLHFQSTRNVEVGHGLDSIDRDTSSPCQWQADRYRGRLRRGLRCRVQNLKGIGRYRLKCPDENRRLRPARDGSLPVIVEVAPVGDGPLPSASASGTANSWIKFTAG